MSIGTRLGLSYGFLIAILAGVGWLGLDRMQGLNTEFKTIVDKNRNNAKLVHDAVARVHANGRLTLQSCIVRDQAGVDRLQAQIERNKKEITRLIEALAQGLDTEEAKASLEAVKKARIPYVASFTRARALLAQKRRAQATGLVIDVMAPRLAEFDKAWESFVEIQGKAGDDAVRDGSAKYAATRTLVIAVVLLACALAASIAVLVTRGIAIPLKALGNAMQTIMDKEELSNLVAVSTNDEIGALAGTFNRMLSNLAEEKRRAADALSASQRRNALRRATSLSTSNKDDTTTIVQGILQNVCEALTWRCGAYWILDESAGRLRCAGFWNSGDQGSGEFEEISRRTTFTLGTGLPGRVWKAQAPAWIEDVTMDANFPRAPIAKKEGLHGAFGFPVVLGGRFHGVLEFFSDKIEEPDEELLQVTETAGQQLGFYIENKHTEESLKQSRLHQSEKLASVGQLAAGVAHEINNPLAVILGFAQGMSLQVKPGDPLELPVKSIEREALRCKALVQNLLTFSRTSQADRSAVDFNEAVEQSLALIKIQLKPTRVRLETGLAEGMPMVLGNKSQLQQVILNLAKNAIDAMPNGGILSITTELLADKPHSWIRLKVSDTGTGIPPSLVQKVFEPFFTTKPIGQGTGLGLSLINEIVQKHSGTIDLESRPGATVFTVKLPVRVGDEMEEHLRKIERKKLAPAPLSTYQRR